MSLTIFNLLNQPGADSSNSLLLTVISICITLGLVYAFKIFVAKSQMEFQEKFESEGYVFDLQWTFPLGIVEIDTNKNVIWVSTHGKTLIDIDDILEMKLVKTSFETSNIYIKTKKEILKYPISSSRKKSKKNTTEQDESIVTNFNEIKEFVFTKKEKPQTLEPVNNTEDK